MIAGEAEAEGDAGEPFDSESSGTFGASVFAKSTSRTGNDFGVSSIDEEVVDETAETTGSASGARSTRSGEGVVVWKVEGARRGEVRGGECLRGTG